jgi:guanylate kinase
MKKGLLFIISAPAGTGKTTLVRMLHNEMPRVVESVSVTTRAPRPNEVNGKDYQFVSEEEFQKKVQAKEFLEYANVFGKHYGTSREYVEGERKKGNHVILVIDTQGAMQLKGKVDAIFIFISPPNLETLRERLKARKSETESAIEYRLSWAEKEMAQADSYDYNIINEDLKTAYDTLRSIVIAEEHKTRCK